MNGMYINLTSAEQAAVSRLALVERRATRDQAAMLIREALLARGALLPDGTLPFDPRYDEPRNEGRQA